LLLGILNATFCDAGLGHCRQAKTAVKSPPEERTSESQNHIGQYNHICTQAKYQAHQQKLKQYRKERNRSLIFIASEGLA